ncbi:GntR family transcriptional regulator [Oceaniglobus ichthyenteri]|uniref:GntR family transcriptional regulator n=1 Tax=Oceaniglobus ichthyenteri TaxID=2136177 RepID=UPI0013DE4413|nr:GntR family transcriptional regulator [Oceaniglobus ichthyenteri]
MEFATLDNQATAEEGDRAALSGTVYERLKDDILRLVLAPKSILQEDTLAARCGVSRTPVREALRKLLDEGLVQRSGRFYQVIELSINDIRDLYEVREALETMAVRLCIERTEASDTSGLSTILEAQKAALLAGEQAEFFRLDSAFHLCIGELSQNAYLLAQLTKVHDKLRLVRGREGSRAGWMDQVVVEHLRIISALERRNVAVAEAEMRYHINSAVRLHLGLPQRPFAMD